MKKQIINRVNGNMIVYAKHKNERGCYEFNTNVITHLDRDKLITNYYGHIPKSPYSISKKNLDNLFSSSIANKTFVVFEVKKIQDPIQCTINAVKYGTEHEKLATNKKIQKDEIVTCFILTYWDYMKDNRPDDYPNGFVHNGECEKFGIFIGKSDNDNYYLIINGILANQCLNNGEDKGFGTPPGIGVKIPRDEQ